MEVTEHCRACRCEVTVEVEPSDFARWESGELIQNAMPYLTAEEREFLICRLCMECWEELFGEEDDQ